MRRLAYSLLLITVVGTSGCESDLQQTTNHTDFVQPEITDLHSLGWMGAMSQPLNLPLRIPDPENADLMVSPGGIVLRTLNDDGLLASAGLQPGDVIVRVADRWLPVKEDPTVDFVAAIERQIEARKETIEIGYVRQGQWASTEIRPDRESLDAGLPLANQRLIRASTAALKQLANKQYKDGSFRNSSKDHRASIIDTSLAGLAFLSADESVRRSFAPAVARSLTLVGQHLDAMRGAENPTTELDPLAAAYAGLFFAEANVDLLEENWLDRFGQLLDVFVTTQDSSGGWNVAPPDTSPEPTGGARPEGDTDVVGTYSTNQVLLAIGALESMGMKTENEVIEKACQYLQQQTKLRIPSSIDRRTKAALSAGSAAALLALNCDRSDSDVRELLNIAMERAHDIYTAPELGLSGLCHLSLAARQMGNESWLRFHQAIKYQSVCWQQHDGAVIPYPNIARRTLPMLEGVDTSLWTTTHVALVLAMQSKQLKQVLAINRGIEDLARNSAGEQLEPGTLTNQSASPANASAEEIKKMILQQLKDRGMDVDESKVKIKPPDKTDNR